MPFVDEPNYVGDLLKYEAESDYSREVVTIASGAGDLKLGTVLGRLTANGEYTPATAGGSNGAQTAIAVLLQDVDASAAAAEAVVLRRHATVSAGALIFDASINTAADRAAAKAQLDAVGIVARETA